MYVLDPPVQPLLDLPELSVILLTLDNAGHGERGGEWKGGEREERKIEREKKETSVG